MTRDRQGGDCQHPRNVAERAPYMHGTIAKAHGVRLVGRAIGTSGSAVVTTEGTVKGARTVIWATGHRSEYPWLHVPVLGPDRRPVHRRGVTAVTGLYFLGLPWLHTRGSALLGWVGRDVEYLAGHIQGASRRGAPSGGGRSRVAA